MSGDSWVSLELALLHIHAEKLYSGHIGGIVFYREALLNHAATDEAIGKIMVASGRVSTQSDPQPVLIGQDPVLQPPRLEGRGSHPSTRC